MQILDIYFKLSFIMAGMDNSDANCGVALFIFLNDPMIIIDNDD